MTEASKSPAFLLNLAAESITPIVAGCAAVCGPAATAARADKAIGYFGPRIVAGWTAALLVRSEEEEREAIAQLAGLLPTTARAEAVAALLRLAPDAGAEDRDTAANYLTAVPRSAQRLLVPAAAGGWRLPEVLPQLGQETLLSLLPVHVPPFPSGADLPSAHYRLDELLGTSAFGALYRTASASGLRQASRAIKFCLDAARAAMLPQQREVHERLRTLGNGSWSGRVARLFSYDHDARPPLFVYEFVPGDNLATLLRSEGKGLPAARVFELVRHIAGALAFLHGHGLVHAGLKATNIHHASDAIHLTDVGLAGNAAVPPPDPASIAERASRTLGSSSLLYRAPELRPGDRLDPGHDLYALGVIWYQLLVGDPAQGLSRDWAGQLAGPPCQTPRGQIELIQRCVSQPDGRPANAQELIGLMRPSVASRLNIAREVPSAPAAAAPLPGPSPLSLRPLGERIPANLPADRSEKAANGDTNLVQLQIERLKQQLADQIEQDAVDAARQTIAALLRLDPADRDALDTKAFLDEEHAKAVADSILETRRYTGHRNWVNCVAFSADGRRILSGSGGALTGGEFRDGEDRSIRLWEVESGREVRQFLGHTSMVTGVAFAPDSRRLVSASRGGTICVWDVETGRLFRRFEPKLHVVYSVAYSPDGRYVLSGSDDKTVRLWDAKMGNRVRRLDGHGKGVHCVVFSPEGRRALTGGFDGTVRLWDVATGRSLLCLEGHGQTVLSVVFAPDGRRAVSSGLDNTIRLWDLESGRQVRQFEGHTYQVNSVAVSPNGRRILSGSSDKTVRLWDIDKGQELGRFSGHTDNVMSVAFAPGGNYALSGSRDATMCLLELPA
jgi:serine/threonine protein kinase